MTNRMTHLLAFGLVAMMGLGASAQEKNNKDKGGDKKSDSARHQASKEHRSACGTVAAVTVLGETVVDYDTGRAAVAQVSYLTVVESPADRKSHQDHAKKEGDAKGKDKQASNEKKNDGAMNRGNVYYLAVTPKTEVCAANADGGKKSCDLAKLELGDRIEVEYDRLGMDGKENAGNDRNKSGDDKHGRSRTVRGEAVSITILADNSSADHRDSRADHAADGEKKRDDQDKGKDKNKDKNKNSNKD